MKVRYNEMRWFRVRVKSLAGAALIFSLFFFFPVLDQRSWGGPSFQDGVKEYGFPAASNASGAQSPRTNSTATYPARPTPVSSSQHSSRSAASANEDEENINHIVRVDIPKLWKTKAPPCSSGCNSANLEAVKSHQSRRIQGGYANRVQIESLTLPRNWTSTVDLEQRFTRRREHVREVCKRYNLGDPLDKTGANAWEFLYNKEYGLLWCNVFKAASSTWFFNFNLLAGYSENHLLKAKDTPISVARKKYPRLTSSDLRAALETKPHPLTFMIARHPFHRLVSAYRDKILSGSRFYAVLCRQIVTRYKHLPTISPSETVSTPKPIQGKNRRVNKRVPIPSFTQFVQFLIDSVAEDRPLDEHWAPMYQFCTPCSVPFDVFAKVETLDEDGNYIIFNSGIEKVIRPKRINYSPSGSSDSVAQRYLCRLSEDQLEGLIKIYKYDLDLFEYDYGKYRNCTLNNLSFTST